MTTVLAPESELRDLVVKQLGAMEDADFDRARAMAMRHQIPLERAIVERSGMPLPFLLRQLAETWNLKFIDLKVSDVDPAALSCVSEKYARDHGLIPFRQTARQLDVAMANPRDLPSIDELGAVTGRRIVPFLAPAIAIHRAQILYHGDVRKMLERPGAEAPVSAAAADDGHAPLEPQAAAPLLDRLLQFAAVTRTSDIHIEPFELETIVRCRIDGRLRDVLTIPPALVPALVARIKIQAGLRIDERRAPQDGQFSVDLGGFTLDFRVSVLPTVCGEKVVLRVHSKEILLQDLEDLGLAPSDYEVMLRAIRRPFGLMVMTGPTGSGKSTSLYAMLMRIGVERQNSVNISTIEDPVEFKLPRINQVLVNPAAGVTFANALRSFLRQDPDVIMVGEIRDGETAELAVRAALVGRLLLTTLHTNDAASAVPRLLDIGVEPYLLASTLTLVASQRLVRRICPGCRESVALDAETLATLRGRPDFAETVGILRREGLLGDGDEAFEALRLYRGRGCTQCFGSGYRRRLAVFELLEIDETIRPMLRDRPDAVAIRKAAIARGMKTMFQDGLAKALLGETTIDEVLRVAL
jgi:type II secretory ATPase GspE/PulE/Tfp pilus assembly ATPase PilB-like protein